jgi:hypothetical protein
MPDFYAELSRVPEQEERQALETAGYTVGGSGESNDSFLRTVLVRGRRDEAEVRELILAALPVPAAGTDPITVLRVRPAGA